MAGWLGSGLGEVKEGVLATFTGESYFLHL